MPEIAPENYEAVYQYFETFEPNLRIQNLGFAVMHAMYSSEVHYQNGMDSRIHSHLAVGGNVILAPNHQSNADTPTIAGLVYEEPFELLRNTTNIPAKADMFEWPVLGKFFPHMRAHPTWRKVDFPDTPEGKVLRDAATDRLILLNIEGLDHGENAALFTQATRKKKQPHVIEEIKPGIARISIGAKDPDKLLIVAMGFAYKFVHIKNTVKLRPVVVVPEPFCPAGMNQERILYETKRRIQVATTRAFELAA